MKLLLISHNWVGYAPYGGTEIHVKQIAETFKDATNYSIYALFPDSRKGDNVVNSYILKDISNGKEQTHYLDVPISKETYRHQEWENIIKEIILENEIELVHFFHLLGHPLSFPLVVKQTGVKVVVSFFDYFMVCPHPNLMNNEQRFCGYPQVSIETCDLCLERSFQYEYGTQRIRRNLISEILYYIDGVHYLCDDQKQRIETTYPHLKKSLNITMGLGLEAKDIRLNNSFAPSEIEHGLSESTSKQVLKIACIGNFIVNKGADIILKVIEYYQKQNNVNISFDIYGNASDYYKPSLAQISSKGVKVHNGYSPKELPSLLQNSDVALFASIWPETFVLALSEAWDCGLVPIAPNLGAFGERISHGKNGFLYDINDPGAIIKILDSLLVDRQQFIECKNNIGKTISLSLMDNIKQYDSLYSQIYNRIESKDYFALSSRVILTARPERWGILLQALPHMLNSFLGKKNGVQKIWSYYKTKGLKKTIKKTLEFFLIKTLNKLRK